MVLALALMTGMEAAAPEPLRLAPASRAQVRILESRESEVAVSGGWHSLKTWAGCALALREACDHPGIRIALCREERASMRQSTEKELREAIIPPWLNTWHQSLNCGWKETESALLLPRVKGKQSGVYLVGLDKPERLLSMNFSVLIIDQAEQLTYEQFTMAKSRTARQAWYADGRIVLLFNPDHPDHWANQRYRFELGNRVCPVGAGSERAEVVLCEPSDGLDLMTVRAREQLEGLEGVWRERYRLNRWTAFEGSVYGQWAAGTHLVPPPQAWARWNGYPPPDWPRYCGIDFGYHPDPFVCQWWARSPEGVFYRYREIYQTSRLVEDHARAILALEQQELEQLRAACDAGAAEDYGSWLQSLNVAARYADHDREDRETLQRHGVKTYPARKDIVAGIQTVSALMSTTQEGGPKLFMVRDALVEADGTLKRAKRPTCTEQEVAGYRWDRRTAKRELPVDENNHGLDAMRYVFHSLASGPRLRAWS